MDASRARRGASVALLVALAGILAIPLKLAGGASHVRAVGLEAAPSTTAPAPAPEPVAVVDPPPPAEAPAPDLPIGEPELTLPGPGIDDGALAPMSVSLPAIVPAPAPPPAAGVVPALHVKALVVGIDDYPGTSHDLRSAVADAQDMAATLARWGVPASNVLVLEDGAATGADLVQGLRWLVDSAGPDDTAVVFYAGHARNLGFGTQALVGSDGWLLTDHFLAELLAPLRARSTWIVLAACYGGGFDELLAPGRIITAAADANSLAYESEAFHRSYLVQYLVHLGLLEGGAETPVIQDAVLWAQAYLQRDAPDRQIVELDASTEAVSIDGVPRARSTGPPAAIPPPGTGTGGGSGSGAAPPASPPPSTPPPPSTAPPRPCLLLGLLCS